MTLLLLQGKYIGGLINSIDVIPAHHGIQQPTELEALDSGSPQYCARNDELFRASLVNPTLQRNRQLRSMHQGLINDTIALRQLYQ